jgi:hypothetical protein
MLFNTLSRNISEELISHVMKFNLQWARGFKNSKKNSTALGSERLVQCSVLVSNKWETMRKK